MYTSEVGNEKKIHVNVSGSSWYKYLYISTMSVKQGIQLVGRHWDIRCWEPETNNSTMCREWINQNQDWSHSGSIRNGVGQFKYGLLLHPDLQKIAHGIWVVPVRIIQIDFVGLIIYISKGFGQLSHKKRLVEGDGWSLGQLIIILAATRLRTMHTHMMRSVVNKSLLKVRWRIF